MLEQSQMPRFLPQTATSSADNWGANIDRRPRRHKLCLFVGGENVRRRAEPLVEEFECKGEWLLKKSSLAKRAEIWEIENVYQFGDRRLWGFLSQSFFCEFSAKEFFNSHGIFQQLSASGVRFAMSRPQVQSQNRKRQAH